MNSDIQNQVKHLAESVARLRQVSRAQRRRNRRHALGIVVILALFVARCIHLYNQS